MKYISKRKYLPRSFNKNVPIFLNIWKHIEDVVNSRSYVTKIYKYIMRDKLSIPHIGICTRLRFHKYCSVRFRTHSCIGGRLINSQYIGFNCWAQRMQWCNLNSPAQSEFQIMQKIQDTRYSNIWTEGVEFHTQDLGSNLSQLQSSPSTYESVCDMEMRNKWLLRALEAVHMASVNQISRPVPKLSYLRVIWKTNCLLIHSVIAFAGNCISAQWW